MLPRSVVADNAANVDTDIVAQQRCLSSKIVTLICLSGNIFIRACRCEPVWCSALGACTVSPYQRGLLAAIGAIYIYDIVAALVYMTILQHSKESEGRVHTLQVQSVVGCSVSLASEKHKLWAVWTGVHTQGSQHRKVASDCMLWLSA